MDTGKKVQFKDFTTQDISAMSDYHDYDSNYLDVLEGNTSWEDTKRPGMYAISNGNVFPSIESDKDRYHFWKKDVVYLIKEEVTGYHKDKNSHDVDIIYSSLGVL